MQVIYGNGGWAEVRDLGLPGRVYVRFAEVEGQLRIVELYVDGQGEPLQAGSLRRFPISALEDVTDEDDVKSTVGPDLSRLASSFGTSFGAGYYKGRHCDQCRAPLRGSKDVALTDWVAMAYFSQLDPKGLPQAVRTRSNDKKVDELPEPELAAPEHGLTDAFLADVGRAYRAAVARRMSPAKTLSQLTGVDQRTVQSWVYKARKRGIMPPATKKGRVV